MGFDLGFAYNFLMGQPPDRATTSGAFEDLGPLGEEYKGYLRKRLNTPASETEQFRLGSSALRDALGGLSATSRQRLGDTSLSGGYADSGAVSRGLGDIDRAEMGAFSSSIRELLLGLEDRRTEGVLPYLSAGSQETLGASGIDVGAQIATRGQNQQLLSDIIEAYASMAGGMCWVARAVYGNWNPRWLIFRHWLYTEAPADLREAYEAHGPALGRAIRRNPNLRATMRRVLDSIMGW